jgi:hypothetical protein
LRTTEAIRPWQRRLRPWIVHTCCFPLVRSLTRFGSIHTDGDSARCRKAARRAARCKPHARERSRRLEGDNREEDAAAHRIRLLPSRHVVTEGRNSSAHPEWKTSKWRVTARRGLTSRLNSQHCPTSHLRRSSNGLWVEKPRQPLPPRRLPR